jgi:hypothetical protein
MEAEVMSEQVIFDNDYMRFSVDEARKLIRGKRKVEQYPDIDALRKSNNDRDAAMKAFVGKGYVLLLDMRDGPMRNDPAFEAETTASRARLFGVFAKVAIVLRTAVGMLQVERLKREGRMDQLAEKVQNFHDDEAAALRFLLDN